MATQELTSSTTLGSDATYPHALTSEPYPRRNCRRSSPRSTTNPENTSTRQHQQKPTDTTHDHRGVALQAWIRKSQRRPSHPVLTPVNMSQNVSGCAEFLQVVAVDANRFRAAVLPHRHQWQGRYPPQGFLAGG